VAEVAIPAEGRKDIIDEVARRARLHIAPGFKDQSKEDGGIGDYLVWKAILQEGAARQAHCIFVTEEEKADWWVKRQGTFQPRPELIDEYRRETGGKSIQLLPLSGLLSAFEAAKEVVQQVQQLEEEKRENDAALAPSERETFTRYMLHAKASRNKELQEGLAQIALVDDRIKRLKQMITKDGPIDNDIGEHVHNLSIERASLVEDIENILKKYPDEMLSFDPESKRLSAWLGYINKAR
jgi:hypothetical protein